MRQVDSEKLSAEDIIAYYQPEVTKLAAYLPWLLNHSNNSATENYKGGGIDGVSISFPVYDSTLMAFVKVCQATGLMDRNYVYLFSRNRIKTVEDERAYIEKATIQEMGDLWKILSKYILSGLTKGKAWGDGVSNGIYAQLIMKMQSLIAFWSKESQI